MGGRKEVKGNVITSRWTQPVITKSREMSLFAQSLALVLTKDVGILRLCARRI